MMTADAMRTFLPVLVGSCLLLLGFPSGSTAQSCWYCNYNTVDCASGSTGYNTCTDWHKSDGSAGCKTEDGTCSIKPPLQPVGLDLLDVDRPSSVLLAMAEVPRLPEDSDLFGRKPYVEYRSTCTGELIAREYRNAELANFMKEIRTAL